MYEHLKDQAFLNALDNSPYKIQYIKMTILDFAENPIREIQGQAQDGGSINVNGSSSLRRTASFTMFADSNINNLTDIDNLISLNKKFKIEIGYKNNIAGYEKYGDIVWFKGGLYVIMQASISNSTSGSTISVQGRDKSVFLNGQAGGTIPAAIILHERQELLATGEILTTYPTIYQIIMELVSEYGGEAINNIIIADLSLKAKQLISYIGDQYLHISADYQHFEENNKNKEEQTEDGGEWYTYIKGQDIGYTETDFTLPGKLALEAGSTVTAALDKICTVLGNYEYFYDLDGKFIFQEKKNYLNNAYSPLSIKDGNTYIQNFGNSKYYYSFNDMSQVTAISANPKYDNLKNDFIVWGQKSNNNLILYHVAIDTKPQIYYANKYMWKVTYNNKYFVRYEYTEDEVKPEYSLQDVEDYYTYKTAELYYDYLEPYLSEDKKKELNNDKTLIFDYFYKFALMDDPKANDEFNILYNQLSTENEEGNDFIEKEAFDTELNALQGAKEDAKIDKEGSLYHYELIGKPCADWREELYRQALERAAVGLPAEYYDNELISYWRSIYNPLDQYSSDKGKFTWYNQETREAWNPDVYNNPGNIKFWLDFLDGNDEIRKYSISAIGKRTKVLNAKDVQNIFNFEVPDVLFIENNKNRNNIEERIDMQGQNYVLYKPSQASIFGTSSTGQSAYDCIRELIYQHLVYNTQINITCLPKYYLEPNNLIYIADTKNGVYGDYVITQFTLPLTYKGTMSITATEALTRI